MIKEALVKVTVLFLTIFCYSHLIAADDTLIVKHYQQQERYKFGIDLLDLALSKLNQPYEIQGPTGQNMNEARGEFFVINGNLDIQFMATSDKREASMIPVKFPVYRGLLGLRLLLVTKENQALFKDVKKLSDLQNYTAVHGKHWNDVSIFPENNLKVITHVSYDRLFTILNQGTVQKGKPDYFHRGINEIWAEQKQYSDKFAIADNVMLFYEMPVYFFVTKKRPDLAKKIEKGLQIAFEDGSYKALFFKYYQDILDKGDLKNRSLIILKNPVLPADTPEIDKSWWLPDSLNK